MILYHGDEYSSSEGSYLSTDIHGLHCTRPFTQEPHHQNTRLLSLSLSLNNVSHRAQWGHAYCRLLKVTGSVPGQETGHSESRKVTGCLCLRHKHVWGGGGTAPRVLKLGTRLGGDLCSSLPTPTRLLFEKHSFASSFRNE